MRRLFAARITKLLRFQPFRVLLFVLGRCVVAVFAISALQRNNFAHYSEPFRFQTKPFGLKQTTQ
jgi:hypothetical protein